MPCAWDRVPVAILCCFLGDLEPKKNPWWYFATGMLCSESDTFKRSTHITSAETCWQNADGFLWGGSRHGGSNPHLCKRGFGFGGFATPSSSSCYEAGNPMPMYIVSFCVWMFRSCSDFSQHPEILVAEVPLATSCATLQSRLQA